MLVGCVSLSRCLSRCSFVCSCLTAHSSTAISGRLRSDEELTRFSRSRGSGSESRRDQIWSEISLLKRYHLVCGNFTKLTTSVQLGTKINWLHFEVKRLKVKVTAGPNALFRRRHDADRQFAVQDHLVYSISFVCLSRG